MDTIAQSFASLVATNNGQFKSEKQAKFLLSRVENGSYISLGNTWRHSYNMEYFCDSQGVTKVTKYTIAKGTTVEWTRRVAGTISLQDAKKIKSLKRALNTHIKQVASRQVAFDAGEYDSCFATKEAGVMLFQTSQRQERRSIAQITCQIQDLETGIFHDWSYYDEMDTE